MLNVIKDLFFPPKCAFCGRITSDKAEICGDCLKKLPFTSGARGKKGGEFFEKCVTPFYYDGVVKDGIHSYKFYGAEWRAAVFAGFMAARIREELDGEYDCITWVPLSKKRLRSRGYDQARRLAEEAAKLLDADIDQFLVKSRHVQPQSGLTAPERRRANISGAYEAVNTDKIQNMNILLIDDVVTTGSTLSECARMLLMAGAERVVCAALARTEQVRL